MVAILHNAQLRLAGKGLTRAIFDRVGSMKNMAGSPNRTGRIHLHLDLMSQDGRGKLLNVLNLNK